MSRDTGEPVTHFIAHVGWSPRLGNCVTACGELVAQVRASRQTWQVSCGRCRATRFFQAALRQRRENLRRSLDRAARDRGMGR